MTDTEKVIREVARFCAEHAQRGSTFLYPNPGWTVDPAALLDRLGEAFKVSVDQIGEWGDEAIAESEGSR